MPLYSNVQSPSILLSLISTPSPNRSTNKGRVGKTDEPRWHVVDINKNNEIKRNERPWKIMIQHMEGLVSKNSKDKAELLKRICKRRQYHTHESGRSLVG